MMALVIGGSGSGKSQVAETMLAALENGAPNLVYVATMLPAGPETAHRIARHRAARQSRGFATLELPTNLEAAALPEGCAVLVECLGTLVANELFSATGAGVAAREAVVRGLEALNAKATRCIVVSNDVFADGEGYSPATEEYRRILAELNHTLAQRSAVVVEVVCGIPLWHKRSTAWAL